MSKCYKTCFVPTCTNNNNRAPCKIYLSVPQSMKARKLWYEAVNLGDISIPSTPRYCCEDHFVLEEDTSNWLYFKTIGTKITLKPHVVPHLNLSLTNSPSKKPPVHYSQLSPKDRKLKKINIKKSLKSDSSTSKRVFHLTDCDRTVKKVKSEEKIECDVEEPKPKSEDTFNSSNHFTIFSVPNNTKSSITPPENSESEQDGNNYGMVSFRTMSISNVSEEESETENSTSDRGPNFGMELLSKMTAEQSWGFIE